MRRLAVILLLLLPLSLRAQSRWEFSLGGDYLLTAYSFQSQHNTWGTGFEAVRWKLMDAPYRTNTFWGLKLDFGLTPQSICGNRFGVAGMLRTTLSSWLDADMGLGLASYSKPSYVTGDPENVYISTPLACLIDLGLVMPLDSRSHVALRLLHSSNGNMRRPNRGLNYFRFEMGFSLTENSRMRYNPKIPKINHYPITTPHYLNIMVAPSLSFSRHSMQGGLYFCYNLSLSYEYHSTPVFVYGGTLDLWYNFSHPWQLPRYHDNYTFPMYFSALGFFESFWGPVSLKGGIGYVIAASSRVMVPVYERLAVYYNFGNNYVGIGINAHSGQAEFIEWSYGRRIPIKKRSN